MKVYLAHPFGGEMAEYVEVFSTRERAEAFIRKVRPDSHPHYFIEEYIVDVGVVEREEE